jgi:starch synthase
MGIFSNDKPRVLFVASEVAPFAKVGGLGEVMRSLPQALRELGYDARVMSPKYAGSDIHKYPLFMEKEGLHPEGEDPLGLFVSNILRYENESGKTTNYFVENMEFYEKRANVYGYGDDALRWSLLSRCVLEFIKISEWKPDIIVASDWQTGLIPNYLHQEYRNDPVLSKIAVLFSIHNLAFQASFDHRFVDEMEVDIGQQAIPKLGDPRLLKLNFMRRGIMYADAINTVSERYAQEITTPEYGERLDDLLRERGSRLFGILNGISQNAYSPQTDPSLEHNYSIKSLKKRLKNRSVIRKRFNLDDDPVIPMFGVVSRLSSQKGFDLLLELLKEGIFESLPFQLVVTGKGDSSIMKEFQEIAKKYPDRVGVQLSFDESLSRMLLAGADAILIPSKYEPSGLTQMEAMRYGAVPVVRATGGLVDSVEDYDPLRQTGTGFVFEKFDALSLFAAMVRTAETYKYPKYWKGLQERGMKMDFSWTKSAEKYGDIFSRAIKLHEEAMNAAQVRV